MGAGAGACVAGSGVAVSADGFAGGGGGLVGSWAWATDPRLTSAAMPSTTRDPDARRDIVFPIPPSAAASDQVAGSVYEPGKSSDSSPTEPDVKNSFPVKGGTSRSKRRIYILKPLWLSRLRKNSHWETGWPRSGRIPAATRSHACLHYVVFELLSRKQIDQGHNVPI